MNLDLKVLANKLLDRLVDQYAYDTAAEWYDEQLTVHLRDPWIRCDDLQRQRQDQFCDYKAALRSQIAEFMNALVITMRYKAWKGVLYEFRVYEEVTVRSSRSNGMVSYKLYYALQHTVTNFDAMHVCREALENGIVQALLELWKVVDKECIGSLLSGSTTCGRRKWVVKDV